ncbi:GntR family transcriptional regulator [Kineococcus sp. SYSU DK002]|uniref:GntR family transcriptional regulator n=1 Tax=Kineococcus sp. SYSU DK002 TaxID=3383123 RepID=UPI003D7D748B
MSTVVLPLATRSLSDAVQAALREWIVTEGAGTGDLVTEVGVAARFGVARPTARVAVERLLAEGLLVRDGRRGARVPVLSADDVHDLYASRVLLERDAHARLSTDRTVPAAAVAANTRLRTHAGAGEAAGVAAADVEFHRRLVTATGSRRLDRMHELLMAEAHLCMGQVQHRHLLTGTVIADEHQGILEAISAGDARLAAERTTDHLLAARDKLLVALGAD